MKKKYTVFVSSTYEDLKEERQEVMKALLEMDCIPCGMEYFPATEDKTLRYIKRIIDDCDYYVLILGGKYGSTDAKGMSYTEKEYRYAKKQKIPMISFLRSDLDTLPRAKCELDPAKAARLESFRKLASDKKICRFWTNKDSLARAVTSSMKQLIEDTPANGWVRADFPIEAAVTAMDDFAACGIERIYPKGRGVRSYEELLSSPACKTLRVLSMAAENYVYSLRTELTALLSRGGNIQLLLSKPGTDFVHQVSELEGRPSSAMEDSVYRCIDIVRAILADAKRESRKAGKTCGDLEIRYYDTELRNHMHILETVDGSFRAYMTVFIPQLGAASCPMIEYADAAKCLDCFNRIWDRHADDVVTL